MRRLARGIPKRRLPGTMNRYERAYADYLDAGRVEYKFESIKLRLADKTFYTPDYSLLGDDDVLEFHEVKAVTYDKAGRAKAWSQDASRIKIKVAAEQYPWFRFCIVYYDRRAIKWVREEVGA